MVVELHSFLRSIGLHLNLLVKVPSGGFVGSRVLDVRGPHILPGDFRSGFKARPHHRELRIALETGDALGVPLPVTSLVHQMFRVLKATGRGDLDHSAIVMLLEDLAPTKPIGSGPNNLRSIVVAGRSLQILSAKLFIQLFRPVVIAERDGERRLRGCELTQMSIDQAGLKYVYLLAGTATLFWLGSTVVDPILPLQIAGVGASEIELGWTVSLLSLTGLFSRIPLTVLTARVRAHRVILLSVIGRLLALALYAFAPSPAWLYPARVIDAISAALIMPVLISEVSRHSFAVSMGNTLGRFLTSYGLALVLGPVICGILLEYLTYTQVILAALSFPVLTLLLLNRVRQHSSIDRSTYRSSARENEGPVHALRRIVHSRNLTILIFIGIVFSIGTGFISAFFAIYVVDDLGLSASMVALAFAALGLANLVGRFPSGMLCDRIGERKPVMLVFASVAVAFFLIAKAPSPLLLVLSMTLIGLAWGIRAIASWMILTNSVEKEDRKLAAAYHSTSFDVGRAIGALSSGFLAVAFSTSDIFLVGSGLMLGALVALFLFRRWPVSIR